jgi:transposase
MHQIVTGGSLPAPARAVWALEDCRHVSGSSERFLIERVIRVHSALMSTSRHQVRGRGKTDSIDALALARAALREGLVPSRPSTRSTTSAIRSYFDGGHHRPLCPPGYLCY